jgi:catechol 2,3-dioxygenase-like lactoylglutathione lyase family enzyme
MATNMLNGINHIGTVTRDLDRLVRFYCDLFGAEVALDLTEHGLRHVALEIGPTTVLHPFEIGSAPDTFQPMFERGQLDHLALNAASENAFRELRKRAIAAGASDGVVRDFGPMWSFSYDDPDGGEHEVIWVKPGESWATIRPKDEWELVDVA